MGWVGEADQNARGIAVVGQDAGSLQATHVAPDCAGVLDVE